MPRSSVLRYEIITNRQKNIEIQMFCEIAKEALSTSPNELSPFLCSLDKFPFFRLPENLLAGPAVGHRHNARKERKGFVLRLLNAFFQSPAYEHLSSLAVLKESRSSA
jgi:hypothetical protein